MDELKRDLLEIADFLSGLQVKDDPNEDKTVHEEIHQWYRDRIKECIDNDMRDVASAYYSHIGKDKRLSGAEVTYLLLDTMKLFSAAEEDEEDD